MPDPYMPDVEVHIAFNAGYNTPAASRTWTDVSTYVEAEDRIRIAFGRQDERSTAGANTLNLTLDNSDGRFTAGRAASPYYPNVKIGRPIRVRVTPSGGTVSTRFVGFVDEWPVEWDGTDAYAMAKIKASSRLSRLGLSTKLKSIPENEILADGPVGYWTLGDPSGSATAAESTGTGRPLYKSTDIGIPPGSEMTFGNAIGSPVDGLTAAAFLYTASGGEILRVPGGLGTAATPQSIRCWVLVGALPVGFDATILTGGAGLRLYVDSAGLIHGQATTGPSINDGLGHDLILTRDGTTERLYVDGVLVASAAAASGSVGGYVGGFSGSLAHVAGFTRELTSTEATAHAQAVLEGFAGERTDLRLLRLLGWAGVPASEVTTDTGVETMTYQQTSGQTVVDALRDVESTEGGVLFDGRDGNVTFHNRAHRYLATAVATLNMAAQHVGADFAPKLDRSALANDVEVSNPTTGQKARVVNGASVDEYGTATASATSVASTADPLLQKAYWLVTSYAEPRTRVPSLTVDVLAHQGLTPSAQTLLAVTVGDLLAVTNAPTQSDTTSPSYFVEGGTETIGPESYEISFNLSPTYPTLSTLVLNSATRGLLDTNLLAF